MIREAAIQAKVPFLNIVQAGDGEPSWRLPTAHELRWLAYTTLAYGGRGLSYFVYWGSATYGGLYKDGRKTPLADAASQLNHELAALSPALMRLDSIGAYHTSPIPQGADPIPNSSPVRIIGSGEFVLGLFGNKGKPSAFMIINRDYRASADAVVEFPAGIASLDEFDPSSKRWRRFDTVEGRARIPLQPGDGRLFRFSTKDESAVPLDGRAGIDDARSKQSYSHRFVASRSHCASVDRPLRRQSDPIKSRIPSH